VSHDFGPMYAVHDAVRRDLARLVSLTGGTAPLRAGRAGALRAHWSQLTGVVLAHERVEDDVLWPALRRAVPAEESGPIDLAVAQHEPLFGALEAVRHELEVEDAFTVPDARERLASACQRAAVLADHHFGLEETRLLPLVSSWLDPAGWAAFVAAWRRDPGPGGAAEVLPFVLDGAHAARAAALVATLDEDDRHAYEWQWRPAYKERVASLW
jgi:Hemerythrin HHE cation binding domain